MNKPKRCAKCGAELPVEALGNLCLKCQAERGAGGGPAAATTAAAQGQTIAITEAAVVEPTLGSKVRYFGDYELLGEIARGGMGVVYRARQVSLNRLVALKMILAGQLAGEEAVKRFQTEAEAAANLQHPNIVGIHEVGEHQGQHYYCMDFVEGQSLAQVIAGKPLAPERAAGYLKTIAVAVHYAHQRGTLHRDLKPQNVLVDAQDQPRIVDFGLAKRIGTAQDLTVSGSMMGSPSYASPEQAAGRWNDVGPHSDVYSLGAILYEMLTGRPPFRGPTPLATLREVLEAEPVAPSALNAVTPRDLETICLKCLEKPVERRYHAARDVAEELERYLKREPILARPAGAMRRGWGWLQRKPWALAALATVIGMVAVFFAYGLWEKNRQMQWQTAHPGEKFVVRTPPLLDAFTKSALLVFVGMTYFEGRLRKHFKRWKLEGIPIPRGFLVVYGVVGLILTVWGFCVAIGLVELYSWGAKVGMWPLFGGILLWVGLRNSWKAVGLHESALFREVVEGFMVKEIQAEEKRLEREAEAERIRRQPGYHLKYLLFVLVMCPCLLGAFMFVGILSSIIYEKRPAAQLLAFLAGGVFMIALPLLAQLLYQNTKWLRMALIALAIILTASSAKAAGSPTLLCGAFWGGIAGLSAAICIRLSRSI